MYTSVNRHTPILFRATSVHPIGIHQLPYPIAFYCFVVIQTQMSSECSFTSSSPHDSAIFLGSSVMNTFEMYGTIPQDKCYYLTSDLSVELEVNEQPGRAWIDCHGSKAPQGFLQKNIHHHANAPCTTPRVNQQQLAYRTRLAKLGALSPPYDLDNDDLPDRLLPEETASRPCSLSPRPQAPLRYLTGPSPTRCYSNVLQIQPFIMPTASAATEL